MSETDSIRVEYPSSGRFDAVGRLIVGGLASRFEFPIDRVDDLLIATETLNGVRFAADAVTLEADADADALVLRIGPFASDPLAQPGVARVILPLVDRAGSAEREVGNGSHGHWVELTLAGAHRLPSGG